LVLETLLQGKIRVKLLTKLLLNPSNTVYLRGLEKEFGVSSNTVRHELNKLSDIKLIEIAESEEGNQKQYRANVKHPMFGNLRGLIMKQVGLDALIEKVFQKLGDVQSVYLTNDWAEGKESPFIDLVVVGIVDRNYMQDLIAKAEKLINKKIRVALYGKEFNKLSIAGVPHVQII
jgi:DNA-binding transcriptional ArsR family regulator